MPHEHDQRAMARYAAVSHVLAKLAAGMSLATAIAKVAKSSFFEPSGRRMRLSQRSLYRWYAHYKRGGFAALTDASRGNVPSQVLAPAFLDFMAQEKLLDPDASIPELIRRAEAKKLITKGSVKRSSAWRAAVKLNLPIFAEKGPKAKDMRRFAYAHRMQMVLCDGKHFRAGESRLYRVVFTFLDDASRYAISAVVGTSESGDLFMRGLMRALRRAGKMTLLYVDNGSGFTGHDVETVCSRLGIALVHGAAGYPEGHGKIERYHQSLQQDLLRSFDANPAIDPALTALELRINHYLSDVYNRRPHEGLAGETPEARFGRDARELDMPDDFDALERLFVISKSRRVSRDNVVKVGGIAYEMPLGYAGKKVTLHRHSLDGSVSFADGQKLIKLHPVELTQNAKLKRLKREKHRHPKQPRPVRTAADLIFEQTYPVIVAPKEEF
jgi:transposase InsO family protein